jgi:predicted DNA-binding transcriptional regulator AlpA
MTHTDHLIPVTNVANILGIGVSTAWLWCTTKAGFPVPMRLSRKCTRWSLNEVNSFAEGLKLAHPCG